MNEAQTCGCPSDASTTDSKSCCRGAGTLQRWSRTLIPTTKEAPADAVAPSHKLLIRAGLVRRVGAGIYTYLPTGLRVLGRISRIIREEMNAAGASEMLMPALEPIELIQKTGRDQDYGDNLFRLQDRHGRTLALAPTHEEIITDLLRTCVSSYRHLPITLYQLQTKFRDEFRPRSALLRGREFLMKDAYSFHLAVEGVGGLDETYDEMHRAYVNIFTRCGLDFTVVEAESGPIGGSASHEFMVNCESGEDTIFRCAASGYAANVEKCEIGHRDHDLTADPTGDLEKTHTPSLPTIEEVGKFMKVKPKNMLKTLVFTTSHSPGEEGEFIVVVVRGDHDANEGKIRDAVGSPIRMAEDDEARKAGFSIGYVSPLCVLGTADTLCKARLLIDPDAAQPGFWAAGADEKDHHVKHFNWKREMGSVLEDESRVTVASIRNAVDGDPSPRDPNSKLEAARGIEVGHIFKLGSKYSDAMGFDVLDEKQERRSVIMGCYGIGVSRMMQACVEMSHNDDGIIWPASIAPYDIHIVPLKVEEGTPVFDAAMDVAERLTNAGLEVLVDDRDERPGVKFKDADLIGCPIRITVGDKGLAENSVEFKARTDTSRGELVPIDQVTERCTARLTQ